MMSKSMGLVGDNPMLECGKEGRQMSQVSMKGSWKILSRIRLCQMFFLILATFHTRG